ncbi:MAG: hypothetical protein GC146_14495 [Limimaricola sp.]|uniref:hypothetical protein n=1 Tax=Limimaricola sp. TaxID=2211665 RepID=UPI001E087BDC|nr:hypothetical protein [Limimaricola sp.]MBI1418424.1 hypothetical protein [Limimaricola sp.]
MIPFNRWLNPSRLSGLTLVALGSGTLHRAQPGTPEGAMVGGAILLVLLGFGLFVLQRWRIMLMLLPLAPFALQGQMTPPALPPRHDLVALQPPPDALRPVARPVPHGGG